MNDVAKAFSDLKSYFSFTYRGVRLEKIDGGVMYNRTAYYSKEELDKAIDKACVELGNSLNEIKNDRTAT